MIVVGEDDAAGMIEARTYDEALDEAGQSHQLTVVRGAHDATTWDNGIRTCLAFLLDD